MRAEQIDQAKNPLLPAALVALKRAALRARKDALAAHTGIVVARNGKVVELELDRIREPEGDYSLGKQE